VLFCFSFFLNNCLGQVTVSFQGNSSLTNGNDFQYRSLSFVEFNASPFYEGVYVNSLSIGLNPMTLNIDDIAGAAYAAITVPPSAYLAFFSIASQFSANGTAYQSVNTSAAEAFMSTIFVKLDEVNSNGVVMQTINLGNLAFVLTTVTTGSPNLRGALFTATQGALSVKITFVASSVVGVLNVPGNVVMTPKTLEAMLEIDNFPYMNTADSVRLTMVVGSAAGAVNVVGSFTQYSSGTGNQGAFFTLSNVAQTDGTITPVQISSFTSANTALSYGNGNFDGQVNATYGAAASFKLVTVTFNPGAKIILFDPAMGVGANYPVSASCRLTFPILSFVIVFVKIFLF